MSSLNKVTLIGHLGKDPEVRTMQNGKKMATFSIATSESWKDQSGDKKEKTEWHNVVIYNENLVSVLERFVKKGSKLFVEGKLQTRKWQDKNGGGDKYATEVVLQGFTGQIILLDGKEQKNNNQDQYDF